MASAAASRSIFNLLLLPGSPEQYFIRAMQRTAGTFLHLLVYYVECRLLIKWVIGIGFRSHQRAGTVKNSMNTEYSE